MDDSASLRTIRTLYAALADGDVSAVVDLLDPQLTWVEAEGFPLSGTYRGPEAVMDGVLRRLATEWADFRTVPHEFIDGGAAVVALGTYSGTYKATGKSFQAPFAHVWKLAGGKVLSYVQYTDTALVARALTNPE